LSIFQNNTFTEIYASHILEHFEYLNDEIFKVLKEWYRVLIPGGKLYVSVPDLDVLAQLFIQKDQLTLKGRFAIMRMIFGGHMNQYDFHRTGLSQDILEFYLTHAGYVNLRKVDKFGFFNDASDIIFNDKLISLNMIAEKPK
ncbi:MAG: methyltransferase domain-containing protein, partial [Bacteroidota bacterium]